MRAERVPVVPEKQVQQAIKQLLRLRGVPYYDLSQPRAAMQTPGLADLLLFVPRGPGDDCTMVWVEVKSSVGRLTEEQRQFQQRCVQAGMAYMVVRSAVDMDTALKSLEGTCP